MIPLVLYCKSYLTDIYRVTRLAKSVAAYNLENIPFFVSAPEAELSIFQEHLHDYDVNLISDEMIVAKNPNIDTQKLERLPGHLKQQIVKSEFWRINPASTYLCLDSDSVFIRNFRYSDFMNEFETPYSVINEAQSLQFEAMFLGKFKILENFAQESALVKELFEREGRHYSFGPMPIVWHRDVWESLEREYLNPRGLNFMDAIIQAPLESRWYGEALLKYQAIPLIPCESFFKVYHYAWQFDQDRRRGIDNSQLAKIYSGVIYQSSWERELDWPHEGGNAFSRTGRRLRRMLGRI